ncbi:hypothetical protein A4H97_29640 [Niastella yeongjuensis]|uniref:Uncharacterized protein n=1 Tax=Niastella yeongjuensis TaxID=354355 RepID=A0A1V9EPG5_9BACT|nr:hypothetical protein [Niastella yeongjuensis]OQP48006.1 hypothetical protein A4H97_29640 [Niastella yeongjuensis]SEO23221.1 hypothetical protein SAMN05660816_02328 [Niastella yeongjuensis]
MTGNWHESIYSYLKDGKSYIDFRTILFKMKEEGMSAQDAFLIFEEIWKKLDSEANEKDRDVIAEVTDIIVGYCYPRWYVWDKK